MKKILLISLLLTILLVSSCKDESLLNQLTQGKTDVKIEKSPGCEGKGGITGCMGKSLIKDITVDPSVDCLKIDANNCNGGVLEVDNKCDSDLTLGAVTISAGSSNIIEFIRIIDGEASVIELQGNVDSYNPVDEDTLIIEGKLGEQTVTISYLKKNVCGEAKISDFSSVSLKMDKTSFREGERITASVDSEKMLLVGFPTFQVYQLVNDEWVKIEIYDMTGALPCSADEADICAGPSVPAQLPEHCQEFDPFIEKFEWDQQIYKTKNIECGDWTATCSFIGEAEPGTYKVVFKYSENCVNEELFEAEENNVQVIEKEFKII